jgi:hypothetical protein
MSCPEELRRLYHEGRVVPFIGAGASMSVSWSGGKERGPSWGEMVDQAIRLLGSNDPQLLRLRGSDLQILEYFKIKRGELAPLTNWLSHQFAMATDDDILASPILAELVALDRCSIYYTTNYDDFLERALRKSGRPSQAITAERSIAHNRLDVEVVKFHGDFNSPREMVVTESQYMDRMRLENAMDFKLRGDILGRAALFIGYSFRDPNVNYIFHLINRLFKNLPDSFTGRRAYIVLPDPSDFERRLFQERNIEVISVGSNDRPREISNLIKQMRS